MTLAGPRSECRQVGQATPLGRHQRRMTGMYSTLVPKAKQRLGMLPEHHLDPLRCKEGGYRWDSGYSTHDSRHGRCRIVFLPNRCLQNISTGRGQRLRGGCRLQK